MSVFPSSSVGDDISFRLAKAFSIIKSLTENPLIVIIFCGMVTDSEFQILSLLCNTISSVSQCTWIPRAWYCASIFNYLAVALNNTNFKEFFFIFGEENKVLLSSDGKLVNCPWFVYNHSARSYPRKKIRNKTRPEAGILSDRNFANMKRSTIIQVLSSRIARGARGQ